MKKPAPRCKECKVRFPVKYFNQQYCMLKDECIAAFVKSNKEKREKAAKKDWKEYKKDWKAKDKKLTKYESEAKAVFQRWVRIRDKDLPCISCNRGVAQQWDGGHFYKAELYSGLIFNEMNCHKQCSRCNDLYSGHENEYRQGLINRFGREYVDYIDSIKDGLRKYIYTKDELTEIKNKYQAKIKDLLK